MATDGSRIIRTLFLRTAVITLLAGVAAAVFSLQLENKYRARTLLILAPMPFEQVDETVTQVAFGEDPRPRANYLKVNIIETLPMPDYKLLLTSEEICLQVRDRLRELYRKKGYGDVNLTHEQVARRMEVRTKLFMQTQEEIEYQHVVELLFSSNDPEIAAEGANYWAELSIALARDMRMKAREGALEFLETQIAETKALLDGARQGKEAIEKAYHLDALRQRIERIEAEVTEQRLQQNELGVDIAGLDAEAAALEKQLQETPPSLPGAPAESNPLYVDLGERLASVRGERANLGARLDTVTSALAALEADVPPLRETLAAQTRRHEDFALQIKYYEHQVQELEMSYYAARISSAEMGPEFKFATAAVPPEEKIAPWRTVIVLVAMFLAGTAVPVHFFSMYALRRYARQIEQAS